MQIQAKTLTKRSGFKSSVVSPILSAISLWLVAYSQGLDPETTRGVVVGALVAGCVAAITFLRNALAHPSVDAASIPSDVARVMSGDRVCNCGQRHPDGYEAPSDPE